MTFTPNPYPSLADAQYEAVVNGRYVKSTFSNANGGYLSFTVAGDLIGFQDDKLSPTERRRPGAEPRRPHDRPDPDALLRADLRLRCPAHRPRQDHPRTLRALTTTMIPTNAAPADA